MSVKNKVLATAVSLSLAAAVSVPAVAFASAGDFATSDGSDGKSAVFSEMRGVFDSKTFGFWATGEDGLGKGSSESGDFVGIVGEGQTGGAVSFWGEDTSQRDSCYDVLVVFAKVFGEDSDVVKEMREIMGVGVVSGEVASEKVAVIEFDPYGVFNGILNGTDSAGSVFTKSGSE